MNTTAPRARAGKPYVPPMTLHRGVVAPIPSTYKTKPLQIDFVLPDEDEQAVRNGFDAATKAPLPKAEPAPEADATKDMKASEFAFWFWSRAMWTGIVFGLGILYARHFS